MCKCNFWHYSEQRTVNCFMFCTGTNLTSHFHHLYTYLSAFILFYPGPESRMASIQDNYNPPLPTASQVGESVGSLGGRKQGSPGINHTPTPSSVLSSPPVILSSFLRSPLFFLHFLPSSSPRPRCLSYALPSCKPPRFGSFCLCLLFDRPQFLVP